MINTDLVNLTFLGLVGYGVVGVISWKLPNLDKTMKFVILVSVVLLASFIPAELGSIILEKAKLALGVAFAMTATGTLANKVGGQ